MLREFTDKNGASWRVWVVDPQITQAKLKDRRKTPVNGWLVFESGMERRRLSPIPTGWDSIDIDALAELCQKAQVVPARVQHFGPRDPPS